jgi:hypothetical protein
MLCAFTEFLKIMINCFGIVVGFLRSRGASLGPIALSILRLAIEIVPTREIICMGRNPAVLSNSKFKPIVRPNTANLPLIAHIVREIYFTAKSKSPIGWNDCLL